MSAKPIKADWSHAILVCRKCSKRQKGGFGPDGRTRLAKRLRKLFNAKKGRKSPVGVIEVGCLDICPKHAVVVIDSRHPDQWALVKPGIDDEALRRLFARDQAA